MYLQNKYTIWYNLLIENVKGRTLPSDIYVENHHILPKSLGGSNDANNIIKLTAKEHYICHLLLTKMVTGQHKRSMSYALWGMTNQKNKNQNRYSKINSRLYEYAKQLANRNLSEERKGKTLEERYGAEKAQKMRHNMKGRRVRSSPSEEELLLISERIKTASIENPWKRNFEYGQPDKKQCPICMKVMDVGNFSKYNHGNECRQVPKIPATCN